MTLRIGTPVKWPNPPLDWRHGTIIGVLAPGARPDFAPFSNGRAYVTRSVTSYLVRERGPGGRILWPNQDKLIATGAPPAVPPLTPDELAWCHAHPDRVREVMNVQPIPKDIST